MCRGTGSDATCHDPALAGGGGTGGGGTGGGGIGGGGTGGGAGTAGNGGGIGAAGRGGMTGTAGGGGGAAGRGGMTGTAGGGGGAAGTSAYAGRGGGAGTGTSAGAGGAAGTTTGGTAGSAGRGGGGGMAGAASGGSTGGAGRGGSGGQGGAGNTGGALTCVMGGTYPPTTTLITDFSDAVADTGSTGDVRFGSTGGLMGGTTRFASATKGALALTGVPNPMLTFSASVEAPSAANAYPYSGFSLFFNGPACINASAYAGISFAITALTGTCQLDFGIQDAAHTTQSSDPNRGLCVGTCYCSEYTISSSTTQVSFTASPRVPGVPATPADPAKLTGIQWVLKPAVGATAPCTGSVTIDNLRFYTAGATGAGGSTP